MMCRIVFEILKEQSVFVMREASLTRRRAVKCRLVICLRWMHRLWSGRVMEGEIMTTLGVGGGRCVAVAVISRTLFW